ncbi:unnamed protein product [Caenorhabditis sp. 36 PRJEB53466]|nr:unnamed protein product [Caenorhabditis sp. 36 PRJEB53466]
MNQPSTPNLGKRKQAGNAVRRTRGPRTTYPEQSIGHLLRMDVPKLFKMDKRLEMLDELRGNVQEEKIETIEAQTVEIPEKIVRNSPKEIKSDPYPPNLPATIPCPKNKKGTMFLKTRTRKRCETKVYCCRSCRTERSVEKMIDANGNIRSFESIGAPQPPPKRLKYEQDEDEVEGDGKVFQCPY